MNLEVPASKILAILLDEPFEDQSTKISSSETQALVGKYAHGEETKFRSFQNSPCRKGSFIHLMVKKEIV